MARFRVPLVGLAAGALVAAVAFTPRLAAETTPAAPVTFSKHVAPIFQAKCQECHQPNSIAPMPLLNYADAKKFASAIKTKVAERTMPARSSRPSVW